MAAGLLPMQSQAELGTRILKERLELVLPWAMERSGIDCWIVAAKENCKDPILKTLYPWDMPDVRRVGILVFQRNREDGTIRKMVIGPHSPAMESMYERVQRPEESVWEALSRVVGEHAPKKIAVNRSKAYGFCDGLTSTLDEQLREALGEDAAKLCDGEELTIRWLQRVTPLEKEVLRTLVNVTHDLIYYSFSQQLITVGETTTTEIEWFMRDVIKRLGFNYWFGPDVDLQRQGSPSSRMFNEVILPGDLLHCDVGINGHYVQLHTDMQLVAYVLKEGEQEAPPELEDLLSKGNRLQDIVRDNISIYQTGNDALLNSIHAARLEGINPMVYTHPLGTFGHGAGPHIGQYNKQEFLPGVGERPIENLTCYALELNVSEQVASWANQLVFMYLEEVVCKDGTVDFLDGRQEKLIVI
ncbi:MAG: M24 family metallopeptidase [Firmicutes bacterium]|nr:M24 family metallopeptidase [Bacillota bacterium]